MHKQQPQFHPISKLPVFTEIVDGILDSSREQLTNIKLAVGKPHVMDDTIINRIIKLYSEQLEYCQYYEKQFTRWKKENNSDEDSVEINRLIKQLDEIKEIDENILAITHSIEHNTIDKIMDMSDEELAFEILTGRIKLPY